MHLGLGQHKSKILADSLFHVWALVSGKHIHLFISWFVGERPWNLAMEPAWGPAASVAAGNYPDPKVTIVSIQDRLPGTQPVEEVWEGNES